MDSKLSYVHLDGRLVDIVDLEWRKDRLPHEDISIPEEEMPVQEDLDDSTNKETFKEQEKKWKDMGIGSFR